LLFNNDILNNEVFNNEILNNEIFNNKDLLNYSLRFIGYFKTFIDDKTCYNIKYEIK